MNVVPLMVFVSLVLVVGSLVLFGQSMRAREHQHADRLALLPISDDEHPASRSTSHQGIAP